MEDYKPVLPASLLVTKPATIADLKFVFSQVERRVKETADDGDKISSKSLTIIGICLTFITGIWGYIMSHLSLDNLPLLLSSFYILFSLADACKVLKPNIYPIRYLSVGSYPSNLMSDDIFNDLSENETAEYRMIYSEILSYEERVMINKNNNDKRNELLSKAYDKLFDVPVFTAVCYFTILSLCLLFRFGLSTP